MKQFLLFPALLLSLASAAQTNQNFETQDFTGWAGFSGMPNGYTNPLTGVSTGITPANVNAYTSNSPHLIVNSNFNGITCNGATPVGQGTYSALINFTSGSNHASGIEQTFTVGPSGTSLVFSYSALLIDANHAATEEPFFRAEVFDASSGVIFQKVIYPGMPNSPLVSCNINNNYYTPWGCDTVSLTAYIGQSVTMRFTAADCFFGDHDGYAFVDAGCLSTGIAEIKTNATDSVYPNPGDGMFFIRHSIDETRNIIVRSIDGKELFRTTSVSKASWVDLRSFAPGIYFLEIENAAGMRSVKKLVKQ
ncbi:MAG: hypothetical protein FD123_244 [Bacteroidetes bacterium]|nr:MAG: hypothetical protein FD123_244 [Bacteroidota bacterium]